MNQTQDSQYYPDDEIDLREIVATLWQGKWIIVLFTIVFAAAGVFYALSKPNIYESSVLLAPAQDEATSGVSGQLGGLASLAGINLGSGGSSQTVVAKEVLQSRAFLSDFIHRHNLTVPLMAIEGWDIENETWVINREVYNSEAGEWLTNDEGESLEPTNWDMVKQFKENHLRLFTNEDIGMVTLGIKSQSPPVAKEWAQKLVHDINEYMRAQDVQEAEARIAYLEQKLRETNIAGMQQVFYQLIESETRTVMLANAQSEYIFKTVDPAVVPQEKSEPQRAIIAIVATVLGGMLGVFAVFARSFAKTDQPESEAQPESRSL